MGRVEAERNMREWKEEQKEEKTERRDRRRDQEGRGECGRRSRGWMSMARDGGISEG